MGLDVYVGSLARYYTGDWETVVQQRARERGMDSVVLRPFSSGEMPDPAEVWEMVGRWQLALNEVLSEHLHGEPLSWNESDAAPYFTEKLDWNGYGALLLLAAYEENAETSWPEEVPEDWQDDPALGVSSAEEFRWSRYAALLAPELWLPQDFDFIFRFLELRGQEMLMGPSPLLLAQLRYLNNRTFSASPEDFARWRTGEIEAGSNFEANAKYGLAVFLDLAESSVEHRLPIKLDY